MLPLMVLFNAQALFDEAIGGFFEICSAYFIFFFSFLTFSV